MTVSRIKDLPYPEKKFKSHEDAWEYCKDLRNRLQEDQSEKAEDFDWLKIDNKPWVDVREYGAKPEDATHDDTVAIQAAINSLTTGGEVFFSKGTHLVSSTITINQNNVRLCGIGWDSIISAASALGANPIFKFEKTSPNLIYYVGLKDIKLSLAHNSSIGVNFIRAIEPSLSHVYIHGNNNAANVGSAIIQDGTASWSGGLKMSKCRIDGLKFGLSMINTTTAGQITDNWILGSSPTVVGSIGIYMDANAAQGTVIKGNDIENWKIGIDVFGVYYSIIGNRFETCDTTPIRIDAGAVYYNLIGNNYTLNMAVQLGNFTGVRFEREEGCFINVNGTDVPLSLYGGNAEPGAALDLIITAYSSSYMGRLNALYTGSINEFGEEIESIETNLASRGTLKIGTVLDVETQFYIYNALAATLKRYGHLELVGNLKIKNSITQTTGTTAPASGTWARGDICWNTEPSAGGTPGWVCVTAGTPGTWKAMANVAA